MLRVTVGKLFKDKEMFSKLPFLILTILLTACTGDDPVEPDDDPEPIAAATFSFSGQGQWLACSTAMCVWQAEGRNTGAGCATTVSGVTRFYDASNVQLGSGNSWTLASARVVRPNEAFIYSMGTVPRSTADNVASYRTEAAWTDVQCP